MNGGTDRSGAGRLLLITGRRWVETSRLALAARDAGFSVHLLAPKGHPVTQLTWVHTVGAFSLLRPGPSIASVLNTQPFDLVLPADDVAAATVFETYLSGVLNNRAEAVVRRSLGNPDSFYIRHARSAIAEIAASTSILTPRTWPVLGEEALAGILATAQFPAVLKSDVSSGGEGTILVNSVEEGLAAYRALQYPTHRRRWLVRHRESYWLSRWLRGRERVVSVQEVVLGGEATLSALAWEGELLSSVGFRVLRTVRTYGPATVIERFQHPDMERAAGVLATRLGLSGPFGLDFILSPDLAAAFLIELNPRAVPTAHLHLSGQSQPVFHALAERVGVHAPTAGSPVSAQTIALFPQVVKVVPGAAQVEDAYLDVPDAQDVTDLCLAHSAGRITATPGA